MLCKHLSGKYSNWNSGLGEDSLGKLTQQLRLNGFAESCGWRARRKEFQGEGVSQQIPWRRKELVYWGRERTCVWRSMQGREKLGEKRQVGCGGPSWKWQDLVPNSLKWKRYSQKKQQRQVGEVTWVRHMRTYSTNHILVGSGISTAGGGQTEKAEHNHAKKLNFTPVRHFFLITNV